MTLKTVNDAHSKVLPARAGVARRRVLWYVSSVGSLLTTSEVPMPRALATLQVGGARLEDGELRINFVRKEEGSDGSAKPQGMGAAATGLVTHET